MSFSTCYLSCYDGDATSAVPRPARRWQGHPGQGSGGTPWGSAGEAGGWGAACLLRGSYRAKSLLLQSCPGCSLLTFCLSEPCIPGRCPGSSSEVGSAQTEGGHTKPWAPLLASASGVESSQPSRSLKACDCSSYSPVPLSTPVTAAQRRAWAGPG